MRTKPRALVVLCALALLGPMPVGVALPSAAAVTPSINAKPGIIKFIGSGRIGEGPRRKGYIYPPDAATASSSASMSNSSPDGHAVRIPDHRRSTSAAATSGAVSTAARDTSLTFTKANPELARSFDGLNHRDQAYAGPGNGAGEPPDQGLCVGNGYVMESVNEAIEVFDTRGSELTSPISLTAFYGYPPAYDAETGVAGPFSFDVSCYFDPDTNRWFHVAATVDVDPYSFEINGRNRIDIAVSAGPSPLGRWNYYAIPAQNDGSEGTPDHNCVKGPCFGDFPHIGADRNGFYVTTNEFGDLFGPSDPAKSYSGVNLYAISKAALVAGRHEPTIMEFSRFAYPSSHAPAFRVWPAMSPGAVYDNRANGTEYLVSTIDCATCVEGDQLAVWAVVNTASLDSSEPAPRLMGKLVPVRRYSTVPPPANQPRGPTPLRACINDTSKPTPYGRGCWRYFRGYFSQEPTHNNRESRLDTGFDINQVYFAEGQLWTAQTTSVFLDGVEKAGIASYILRPTVHSKSLDADLVREDRFGLPRNHLMHPSVAATTEGRGIISFTLVGDNHYASAAYTTLDPKRGVGELHIAARGRGPVDGFTGYPAFGGPPDIVERFGDYGAAAVDGTSVWVAAEYIGQTCTFAEYLRNTPESPLFSCGLTRSGSANWGTRISELDLD